ncbi:hypothetical protein CCHR01_10089 [Colletotrichum chrysophilum]|uniref:Uncharacterized protein n=1 Tax=Colletotrichum chrysophilum TaxID=1836956 RepID=A0AAD9AGJ7_9PEZI|nr:hypothetical protein CCHR01_10089 [Colletotrichum chrysophilum]
MTRNEAGSRFSSLTSTSTDSTRSSATVKPQRPSSSSAASTSTSRKAPMRLKTDDNGSIAQNQSGQPSQSSSRPGSGSGSGSPSPLRQGSQQNCYSSTSALSYSSPLPSPITPLPGLPSSPPTGLLATLNSLWHPLPSLHVLPHSSYCPPSIEVASALAPGKLCRRRFVGGAFCCFRSLQSSPVQLDPR